MNEFKRSNETHRDYIFLMTATAPLVKMAACPPIDGDGVDSENFGSTTSVQVSKVLRNSSLPKSVPSGGNTKDIPLDGEKV